MCGHMYRCILYNKQHKSSKEYKTKMVTAITLLRSKVVKYHGNKIEQNINIKYMGTHINTRN